MYLIALYIYCKLFVFMFLTLFPRLEHPPWVDMCALQIFIIIIIIINIVTIRTDFQQGMESLSLFKMNAVITGSFIQQQW